MVGNYSRNPTFGELIFMSWYEIVTYAILLLMLSTGLRVVLTSNVVHAAVSLVLTLAFTAGLFLMLAADFVAWVLVLVYIGAVIVLFLFGIMITRAPLGKNAELDNVNKIIPAIISLGIFSSMSYVLVTSFSGEVKVVEGASIEQIGLTLLGRFVLPFEIVSFILLAALIGGIALARKDEVLISEDQV